MEQKEFIKQLSKYARLKFVKVAKSAAIREPEEAAVIWRDGKPITIDLEDNPTLNVVIAELIQEPKPCDSCPRVITDRVVNKRLLYSPTKHWRETCSACKMSKHPGTGEFSITNSEAVAFFKYYLPGENK